MLNLFRNLKTIEPNQALIGRDKPLINSEKNFINGRSLNGPWPSEFKVAIFALGCFWGAERLFWNIDGVYMTSVGYAGGFTPNPTYEEVCSGNTGHAEAVQIVYDSKRCSYSALLKIFFESHNPTQGMRQGNDKGTQYRSMILFLTNEQKNKAIKIKNLYNEKLLKHGFNSITTEIKQLTNYYLAEIYHQQYLSKNPNGYCGLDGTGIKCP